MDQRPSGWYDDPDEPSRLRYWNGEAWTERTHFKAPMPAPQPPKPPVARLRPSREPGTDEATVPDSGRGDLPADRRRTDVPEAGRTPLTANDSPRPWSSSGRPGANDGRGRVDPRAGEVGALAPAPYWRRALAYLLDLLVVGAVFTAFLFAITPFLTDVLTQQQAWLESVLAAYQQKQQLPDVPPALVQVSMILGLIYAGMLVLYDTVLVRAFGATVGGLALGTRVCDATGARPTAGRLLARSIVKYAGWILGARPETLLVGWAFTIVDFLWPVSGRRHRALHDVWSGTRVVRV